jgi:hypothetical protein
MNASKKASRPEQLVKPGQTNTLGPIVIKIACKYFAINNLDIKSSQPQSGSVKPSQSDLADARAYFKSGAAVLLGLLHYLK